MTALENSPPRPNISVSLELVTPETAEQLISKMHTQQRRKDARHVQRIASDMLAGRYIFTGDPVVIDWHGLVINAQHRLNAIAESRVPQWLLVVRGVDPKALSVIDNNNKPRTLVDVIRILGGKSDKPVIDAIAFHAAGGVRDTALAMSNPERVELAQNVSEEIILTLSSLSQCATSGKLQSRPLLAAVFGVLCAVSEGELPKLVGFLEASLKNDMLHTSYSVTANTLFNFLHGLKRSKKTRTAQDYDDRVMHAVRVGCKAHLEGRQIHSSQTFGLRRQNTVKAY